MAFPAPFWRATHTFFVSSFWSAERCLIHNCKSESVAWARALCRDASDIPRVELSSSESGSAYDFTVAAADRWSRLRVRAVLDVMADEALGVDAIDIDNSAESRIASEEGTASALGVSLFTSTSGYFK